MTDTPMILWSGKSGTEYRYLIFPIGATFKPVAGNYIFTRQTENGRFRPIYIGETDNLEKRLTTNHEKMPCINRHGGTHIHVHTSSGDVIARQKEESDIRDKWNPPCNLE